MTKMTHTWISFGCLSLFMMCASERKSLGSIVPKNICFEGKGLGYETELYKSLPSRLFLSLMFAEGAVMIRRGIIFPINITSPFSSTLLTWVAIIAFTFQPFLTCLQGLDGDRGGVVPKSLPHFSKLAVAKLSHELEAGPLDLPLVPRVVGQVGSHRLLEVDARLPEVDAQPVRVPGVMLHQLLQGAECCASGDEETTLVQLADPIMLHGVPVSDGKREVVPPRLRVSDQERSVFILTKQQLLLSFESLYLSKIPPKRQNKIT